MGQQVRLLAVLRLLDHVHGRLRRHHSQESDRNPDDPRRAGRGYSLSDLGIINIGYVINEVGRFMQIINEGQDRLNRNISDAEKLAENYRLPEELTGRLRSYLINNQIASNRFNVEQEEAFMKKLSEGVREGTRAPT